MSGLRNPPFRAEHLGSLLRPDPLLKARYAVADGEKEASELLPLEDTSVKEAVQLQQDCGFSAIGDGEYRYVHIARVPTARLMLLKNSRHMFWGEFFEKSLHGMKELQLGGVLSGYSVDLFRPYAPDVRSFLEAKDIPNSVTICVDKIKHNGKSTYIPELQFVQSLVPKEQWGNIKLTMPSPSWYHFRYKAGSAYPKEIYANDKEYFADVSKAYSTELKILYDVGLRNVQVDDPNLACTSAFFDRHEQWSHTKTKLFRLLLGIYAGRLGCRQGESLQRGRNV